jgi:NADH-quinone oxidoreductase subunit H
MLATLRDRLAGSIGEFWATLASGAVLIMAVLAVNVLFLVWLERKLSGHIQRRLGPMEVGPHGVLQTVADMLKLLGKQLLTPVATDRTVYLLAPVLVFLPTLALASLIPVAGTEAFAEQPYGLLLVLAISAVTVLAIFMAGWSSNNKYAVLGGMRSVAQVIAYEIPVLLAVLSVVMVNQSTNLRHIVEAQRAGWWNVVWLPVACLLFFVGMTAETNRAPFDIPEAESELVGGFHTEYSGMRFAMFFFAEYTNMLVLGALGATLFFGGWSGPFLPGFVWIMLKAYLIIFVMMWFRWTWPRLRFDQLMTFAWKFLIPVALANLVVYAVALAVLARRQG